MVLTNIAMTLHCLASIKHEHMYIIFVSYPPTTSIVVPVAATVLVVSVFVLGGLAVVVEKLVATASAVKMQCTNARVHTVMLILAVTDTHTCK